MPTFEKYALLRKRNELCDSLRASSSYSEESIATLLSDARERAIGNESGGEVCVSFHAKQNSVLLQQQPGIEGDLRKYNILSIAFVLPVKAAQRIEREPKQNDSGTRD